jgi:ParB-like chromosome segregation protein Spo0J
MSNPVRMACRSEVVELPLAKILPMRLMDDSLRRTAKYQCIERSIQELGLIEPLVVFPQSEAGGAYILLDGHVRLMILKSLGVTSTKCLISTDDEGFTYNHKVSRLSVIQEHFMILRAIKNGVPEERIARSLNVNVQSIREKRDLLDGICPEAVKLLREKRATANALRQLRLVKPMRQIEIAELMCSTSNFSSGYAKCLVAATPEEFLLDADRGKEARGLSPEDISRMEHEMESLGREFKIIEDSYGKNTVNLVVVVAYLRKLLDNSRVSRYLSSHHREIHAEFEKLVENRSLTESVQAKAE